MLPPARCSETSPNIQGFQLLPAIGPGQPGVRLRVLLDFIAFRTQIDSMKLILSTHNVTLTKAIEDHILIRIDKLEHFDRWAVNARVTLEHDTTKAAARQFKCSIRLAVPGPDLFAEDCEADLYTAIDVVTKKIEQQIRKRQSKYKARNHTYAARSKRSLQEDGI